MKTPDLFLKRSSTQGSRWTYGQFSVEHRGEETVTVPAGAFACTRLSLVNQAPTVHPRCNIIGNPDRTTIWLSEGTGLVKQEWVVEDPGPLGSPPLVQTREFTAFRKP